MNALCCFAAKTCGESSHLSLTIRRDKSLSPSIEASERYGDRSKAGTARLKASNGTLPATLFIE